MARNGVKTGGGSRKGIPNKATADSRRAIGMFVDGNVPRMQGWLDQIANGVKALDEDGNETNEYIIAPNPEKAFMLVQSVIEHHVPKLSRVDNTLSGPDGGPVKHVGNFVVNFVGKNGK